MDATLTDPNSNTVFDYYPYHSGNAGPYVLTASGTYTLTLTNNSGSSGTYDFNMLVMPDSAATSLAAGPTQTVGGTLSTGRSHRRLQLPRRAQASASSSTTS